MNELEMARLELTVFKPKQLEQIHAATLEVLNKTGVRVESELALELFHSHGARVESFDKYGLVKFPGQMVETALQRTPRQITYHAREPGNDYFAPSNQAGFTTFGECTQITDLSSGRIRVTSKDDCCNAALLCDYLREISVYDTAVNPSDMPVETQVLRGAEACFSHTGKHVFLNPGSGEELKKLAEMAVACVGGRHNLKQRPIFSCTVCPASPLVLFKEVCEVIIEAARLGIGLIIYPMPLAGVTSPVTLAGTLVSFNAEVLSAIVLAQLTAPGTACTYASACTLIDLKKAVVSLGAPEMALMGAGVAKLARYYGIPCIVSAGMSDSKLSDAQVGYESAGSAAICALAGADIIAGAGTMEQGIGFDYAKLLMDAEMFSMIRSMLRGIDTSDEYMPLEVIQQVGAGNDYLKQKHTLRHMREHFQPQLFDRNLREIWADRGGQDLTERAYEKAAYILRNHKAAALSTGARQEMRDIVKAYEAELGIKSAEGGIGQGE